MRFLGPDPELEAAPELGEVMPERGDNCLGAPGVVGEGSMEGAGNEGIGAAEVLKGFPSLLFNTVSYWHKKAI